MTDSTTPAPAPERTDLSSGIHLRDDERVGAAVADMMAACAGMEERARKAHLAAEIKIALQALGIAAAAASGLGAPAAVAALVAVIEAAGAQVVKAIEQ
jgi:hypothetical protein